MNKTEFIKKLSLKTNYSFSDCQIISNILENKFFFNSKNKDTIINQITTKLDISSA